MKVIVKTKWTDFLLGLVEHNWPRNQGAGVLVCALLAGKFKVLGLGFLIWRISHDLQNSSHPQYCKNFKGGMMLMISFIFKFLASLDKNMAH
jgi:hypothetical protein